MHIIMHYIRSLFTHPTAKEIAQQKYDNHQRRLLEHEESAEYHRKMTEFCRENINRLSIVLKKGDK